MPAEAQSLLPRKPWEQSTNYSISSSSTWNTQYFSSADFGASSPGLSGGTDPGLGTNPLITLYTYDTLANLTCAVPEKGTDTSGFTTCAAAPATWRPRSFVYDSLSRLTSATNPESGTITYSYDANGNVATKVAPVPNKIPADTSSPQTVTTTFYYDVLNRLTKKTYSDGTATAQYGYDGGALSGCTYAVPTLSDTNPIGRRTSMCDGSGATHWALDIASGTGWKTTEARNIAGVTKNTVSQDNFGGMLNQLTYPSGRVIAYTPNGSSGTAGRYLSAIDTANSINYAQGATYAPFGALLTMTNGAAPITVTNSYNERLQPATLSAATAANTLFSRTYDFHRANGDNGNVFQVINNLDNLRNQSFTYDALNRIATAQSAATSGTKCWGESFTVDVWSNLTNKTVTKCTAEMLNVPATTKNQISGYCYDLAGNLLGTSGCPSLPYTPTYTYDGENRLKAAGGVTYTYDGDGNRVKKSNGTLYWGPLAESDLSASTTSWKEYVFFDDKRIARRDASNSSVHYFYSDHLGSSSVIANATGTLPVEEDLDYFPYGGIAYGTQSDHYLFTGKERDTESGLDNFGARFDSSTLGRFMTPDWAAKPTTVPYAKFGDPQTLNLYAYVENAPVNQADADGHCGPGEQEGQGANAQCNPGSNPGTPDNTAPGPQNSPALQWIQTEAAGTVEYGKEVFNILSALPYVGPFFGAGSASVSASQGKTGEATTSAALAALSVVPAGGDLKAGVVAGEAGRFSSLVGKVGDELVAHHMPQAALGFTSRAEGGALVMQQAEHVMTRTFGGRGMATAGADAGMPFRSVLAKDIRDVRGIVGSKYNEGMQKLTQYYHENFPGLISK